jgi:hypothetical protein
LSFRFNPTTGTLDLVPESSGGGSGQDQTRTITELVAAEEISALKLCYVDEVGLARVARSDGTYLEARCVGLSLSAIGVGQLGQFLTFGEISDPFFTWVESDDLYLHLNGGITSIAPTSGFLTPIGSGLGLNKVLINIKRTIIL